MPPRLKQGLSLPFMRQQISISTDWLSEREQSARLLFFIMELYIHIPFCKSKCAYCDFNSVPNADNGLIFGYLNALNKEIAYAGRQFSEAEINTVYIGGGTPSLLLPKQLESVVNAVYTAFPNSKNSIEEFSVESNPESITKEKLEAYKNAGINRISVGVQSLNDDNLQTVGRLHNASAAIEKLYLASEFFQNISADLIIGLPYDTTASVINEVKTLAPLVKHLSMYELTLAENTPLFKRIEENSVWLPDDDETQDLFEAAFSTAEENGFERYEVSNFAKDGKISKHNFGYWTREEYIGFGAGAASFLKTADGRKPLEKEVRFSSPKDINAYIGGINCVDAYDRIPRRDWETLSASDVKNERIMLGLRTARGVPSELLADKITPELERFFELSANGNYRLNDKGFAVMNSILVKLI